MAEQAFPFLKPHEDVGTYISGMTLRDYFAAKAMMALVIEPEYKNNSEALVCLLGGDLHCSLEDLYAIVAYKMADAMLEARK